MYCPNCGEKIGYVLQCRVLNSWVQIDEAGEEIQEDYTSYDSTCDGYYCPRCDYWSEDLDEFKYEPDDDEE